MRQDGQQGTTADDAPEARREETAILDAMDDGGEVLAVDTHSEQLFTGAYTVGTSRSGPSRGASFPMLRLARNERCALPSPSNSLVYSTPAAASLEIS